MTILTCKHPQISQYLESICRAVRYVDGGSWADSEMHECQAKARQDARQFENGVDGAAICSDCNQRRRSSSRSLSGHRPIGNNGIYIYINK